MIYYTCKLTNAQVIHYLQTLIFTKAKWQINLIYRACAGHNKFPNPFSSNDWQLTKPYPMKIKHFNIKMRLKLTFKYKITHYGHYTDMWSFNFVQNKINNDGRKWRYNDMDRTQEKLTDKYTSHKATAAKN